MVDEPDTLRTSASTSNLSFIYPWRPEQQRVLDRLDKYMDDKRVHIVAAPGAGKTVLGLEIFNRLDLKTLTLSPTVLVKNQWIERLLLFTGGEGKSNHFPMWTSSELSNPGYFTSTTYQALYSFDKQFKKNAASKQKTKNDFKDLKQWFDAQKIELLILDEAHHLKASWWAILYALVKDNKNLIIVSLTATPPYDSNTTEWSRYKRLCGPVDEEISIPELVKSRSLCPHQDYIWLVKTDEKNIQSLERYEKNLDAFLIQLNNHEELNYLLSLHEFLDPSIATSNVNERQLLLNLETLIALLQLLKHWQKPLPHHLMQILDLSADDLPALTANTWQVLLQSFLDGEFYPSSEAVFEFRKSLTSLLKGKHFLKYNRVQFDNTQRKLDAFNKTEERISACYDIAKIEVESRKSLLRMVVLADYIRDEELTLSLDGRGATTGAYPIFHHFIHQFDETINQKIALLTGRICIIPRVLLDKLFNHLPPDHTPTIKDYSEHKDYVVCGGATGYLSAAYTKLLEQGDLHIIVGTRALLGEGWDAPFLNALVMATQTKAYVATNQLRGRVMRIDPNDDFKTASIWHIVATAPQSRLNNLIFENLQKRFRTFAGLHAYDLKIESGTERLSLQEKNINSVPSSSESQSNKIGSNVNKNADGKDVLKQDLIQQNNDIMQTRLNDDLFNLQARWQNALSQAKQQVFQVGLHHTTHENSQQYSLERLLAAMNERKASKRRNYNMASLTLASVGSVAGIALLKNDLIGFLPSVSYPVAGLVCLGLYKGNTLKKPVGAIEIANRMARVILTSLHQNALMRTELVEDSWDELINIRAVGKGVLRFSLSGYTRQENETFLEVLNEFLQPLTPSRYLLSLKPNPAIQDLFTIPKDLGNNKKDADAFLLVWNDLFPEFKKANIIQSSSLSGAKLLLKASAKRVLSNAEAETATKSAAANKIQMIERWE